MHGGTVGTDPVAGQSQRGRRRGQPAAAVPIMQVGEQKWHRCRALLGRLAALRQQGRLSAGDLGDVEVLRQHRISGSVQSRCIPSPLVAHAVTLRSSSRIFIRWPLACKDLKVSASNGILLGLSLDSTFSTSVLIHYTYMLQILSTAILQ